jgi:dTDP-4-dehydrorhamnose reductase
VRALVVGASGQVGGGLMQALRARGHEATGTYTAHAVPDAWPLDLRNTDAVEHAVRFVKPDWIFCPAGLSHVDYCEDHAEEAFALNRDAPLFLGRMAQRAGAAFVYYSSDYVFDGKKGSPYVESDSPNPLGAYARSKLHGEAAAGEQAWIVRTSWLFAPTGHNFLLTMLRLGAERDEIAVVGDQRGSPTYAPHLAAATPELVGLPFGVYHVAAAGDCTWADFAEAIFEEAGLETRVRRITTAEFGAKAPRPAYSVLRSEKEAPKLPHWREGLRECLSQLDTSRV